MNKKNIKRIVLTILTIIWMTIIFLFSNQPATKSTNTSQSFIRRTIISIYKFFDNNASEEKLNEIVETFDVPIRKLGHFTEYFILGVLVFLTLKAYGINNIYIALLICFIYSCSDEIHQLFIEERSGNIKDVFIDTLGSFTSIMIIKKCNKK